MNKLFKDQDFHSYKPLNYIGLCDMMDQLLNISIYNREEEVNNSLFRKWLISNRYTNVFLILSTVHPSWLQYLDNPLMQNHRHMCMKIISVLQPDLYKEYLLRSNYIKNKTDFYP